MGHSHSNHFNTEKHFGFFLNLYVFSVLFSWDEDGRQKQEHAETYRLASLKFTVKSVDSKGDPASDNVKDKNQLPEAVFQLHILVME